MDYHVWLGRREGFSLSGNSDRVIQCVLNLDPRHRPAEPVPRVSGAAGTLSAVPLPTARETQQVYHTAQSVLLPQQGEY